MGEPAVRMQACRLLREDGERIAACDRKVRSTAAHPGSGQPARYRAPPPMRGSTCCGVT